MKSFDGDPEMFHRVRIECRKRIVENKNESDIVKIHEHIFFGEESRDFLENNIIQGKLQNNGNYRFKAKPEHAIQDPININNIEAYMED
ncbi:hypothetical protein pb186bvf_012247 [Paramecium bursaria]